MTPILVAELLGGILAVVLGAIALAPRAKIIIDEVKPKPDLTDMNNWVVGPVYNGQPNPSKNMDLHPGPGFVLDVKPGAEAHYVTVDYGSLKGKTSITIKGTVEGDFTACDGAGEPSLCLYFQRLYDDWQASESDPPNDNDTEGFRWYATGTPVLPLAPGPFEITAKFTDKWTAVMYSDSLSHSSAFAKAIESAGEVGFVLGGGGGWGHGVKAPLGGKITISEYRID